MRNPKKRSAAVAALTGLALVASMPPVLAADVQATPIVSRSTSTWTPPSSDPSGIAFIPGKGLLVSDAEIEETALTAPIGHNSNLFSSSLAGVRTGGGSTVGWSNEPTGVSYVAQAGNPWNGHLFVTDDDRKEVFDISSAGADGQFGTADDGSRTSFKTSPFGNTDPEDVAFDTTRNEMWLAGGLSTIISRVNPGADNNFATTGDNVTKNFPIPQLDPLKPPSPEGIAYDPQRQSIYVLDGESTAVFEFARNGALLNRIFLDNVDMQSPGGITLDPASTGNARTFYIADRGLDPNGTRPANCPVGSPPTCEPFNDGVIHEVRVNSMPAIGNRPPLADAGEDHIADTNETVTVVGSGEDGETPSSPAALTYSWTRVSGSGAFTLGTPNAPTTTASFTQAGTHTLRLTVSDGAQTDFDDVVINVFAPNAPRTVSIPIRIGDDDAQEQVGTSSNGFTDLQSADNELGNTNGTAATAVLTGLRFTSLPIVKGSTITSARVQFSTDEINQPGHSLAASYVIKGQRIGNAPPFIQGNNVANGSARNISSRTPTAASVAWNNVPVWTTVREEGANQRTPELAPILQEIVNLPDWSRGNAAVLTIANAAGNLGRRTAEAKDGRIPPYLTVTYRTPQANVAPIVSAGSSLAVTVSGVASLDGTVTDDGKPGGPVTTTWSKVSGPGNVSFGNAAAVDTTASFSQAGTYTLRLSANDGALTGQGDVVVTVQPAVTPPPVTPPGAVQPSLTAAVSSALVGAGQPATISGLLSPSFNGQAVKLQRRSGTSWTDVATQTVPGGTSALVRFSATRSTSGTASYRLFAPATANSQAASSPTVTVLYYRLSVLRVIWDADVVKVKNVGSVKVNLQGWTLKNKKNGKSVVLPAFNVKPGKVVKIHTGDGVNTAKHLYLDTRSMWGRHGKALLRDAVGSLSNGLRY